MFRGLPLFCRCVTESSHVDVSISVIMWLTLVNFLEIWFLISILNEYFSKVVVLENGFLIDFLLCFILLLFLLGQIDRVVSVVNYGHRVELLIFVSGVLRGLLFESDLVYLWDEGVRWERAQAAVESYILLVLEYKVWLLDFFVLGLLSLLVFFYLSVGCYCLVWFKGVYYWLVELWNVLVLLEATLWVIVLDFLNSP